MPSPDARRPHVFWISALVVTAVALTPQIVGSLLAGGLPFNVRAHAADLDLRQFQADLNTAVDETRLVVLLSPT